MILINFFMSLLKKHCAPPEGGFEPIPRKQAQDFHTEVPMWTLHQKSLEREFRFKNFKESMDFVKKVSDIVDKEGHHPDISIFYGRVRLLLTTHVIGGLSENDFIMAAKIDALLLA